MRSCKIVISTFPLFLVIILSFLVEICLMASMEYTFGHDTLEFREFLQGKKESVDLGVACLAYIYTGSCG